MNLDSYSRTLDSLIFKRHHFVTHSTDWYWYTNEIDLLLADAQDTLTDVEFNQLKGQLA